jgi:uncharacterized protein YndB with AHSA1/START domain
VPKVSESMPVAAPVDRVWRLVSDPHSLPRWWPRVQRVEEVSDDAWTMVLISDSGKPIRADYTLTSSQPQRQLEWRQELVETPFERMLSEARVEIELEEGDPGTVVTLRSTERLRGLARLGRFMVRRAASKRLNEALENLDGLVGSGERGS